MKKIQTYNDFKVKKFLDFEKLKTENSIDFDSLTRLEQLFLKMGNKLVAFRGKGSDEVKYIEKSLAKELISIKRMKEGGFQQWSLNCDKSDLIEQGKTGEFLNDEERKSLENAILYYFRINDNNSLTEIYMSDYEVDEFLNLLYKKDKTNDREETVSEHLSRLVEIFAKNIAPKYNVACDELVDFGNYKIYEKASSFDVTLDYKLSTYFGTKLRQLLCNEAKRLSGDVILVSLNTPIGNSADNFTLENIIPAPQKDWIEKIENKDLVEKVKNLVAKELTIKQMKALQLWLADVQYTEMAELLAVNLQTLKSWFRMDRAIGKVMKKLEIDLLESKKNLDLIRNIRNN